MSGPGRPLPVRDRDSAPWWDALTRHEFLLQACAGCGRRRWPPRALCQRCGSFSWEWAPATGRGTVTSWVVNHHAFNPAFSSPYVVLAVQLDDEEDIVMLGGWGGAADGTDLRVGLPVLAGFDDLEVPPGEEPVTLIEWHAATGNGVSS